MMLYYDAGKGTYYGNSNRQPVFFQNSTESLPMVFVFELLPNNQIGPDDTMDLAAFEARLGKDEITRMSVKAKRKVDVELEKRKIQQSK